MASLGLSIDAWSGTVDLIDPVLPAGLQTLKIQGLQVGNASVDLDIHRGEFAAIVGPSGSGKSALMKMLGLLEAPTSGGYRFQGVPEQSLSTEQRLWLRRRFFGFVPQEFHLLRSTSLQGNVALPLMYRGLSAERCQSAAMRALALVGLEDQGHKMPDELDRTQHGKAAIARALVTDPALIVADEPTGDLDRATGEEVLALMDELHHDLGKTIVMVTHDPKAASRASRMIHLEKGVLVDDPADAH